MCVCVMEMPRLKEKFSAAADREGLRAEGEGKGGGGEEGVGRGNRQTRVPQHIEQASILCGGLGAEMQCGIYR